MSHCETIAGTPPVAPFVAVLSTPLFGGAWILSVNGDCYPMPMRDVSLDAVRMAARIVANAIGAELRPVDELAAEHDFRHVDACERAREAIESMAEGDLSRDDMIAMAKAVVGSR